MRSKKIQEKIEFLVRRWLAIEKLVREDAERWGIERRCPESQLSLVFLSGLDDYVVEDLYKEALAADNGGD